MNTTIISHFKNIKRVDKLPLDVRIDLQKKGIYDGLVIFTEINEKQSLQLPSQILEETFKGTIGVCEK